MTKLTKEQIEKERVKFEETLHQYKNGESFTSLDLFDLWLARAELDKGE